MVISTSDMVADASHMVIFPNNVVAADSHVEIIFSLIPASRHPAARTAWLAATVAPEPSKIHTVRVQQVDTGGMPGNRRMADGLEIKANSREIGRF